MLDERYLTHGLNALCRAHETDYFADGHRGAAIVSAYYLCQENGVEDGVPEILQGMIDEHWTHTPLCQPFPDESPNPALLSAVLETMEQNMAGLRQVGHNVIFPSLALRVFRDVPEAATPSRVAGLCRLIECFSAVDDITVTDEDDIPRLGTSEQVAELALEELLGTMEAFIGRGQGWSGHLLTYCRALLDLRKMGYDRVATAAEGGFRVYLKRIRMGPADGDRVFKEHPDIPLRPLERAYWERRRQGSPALGHLFKYPYGFYGLMELARDPDLKRQCLASSFRIF
jgi:hypothetical protein